MRDVWNTSGAVLHQLAANLNVGADGLAEILNNATDAERERLLNQADAPLQARREHENFQAWAASAGHLERDEAGAAWQVCGHDGCTNQPLDGNGLPVKSPLRQWWCALHASEAPASDHVPWTSPFIVGPHGLVDVERDAVERQQAEREQRRLEERRKLEREEREAYARDRPAADDSPWWPSGPGWWS